MGFTFKFNKENFSMKGVWKHFKYGLYGTIHLMIIGVLMYCVVYGFESFTVHGTIRAFLTLLICFGLGLIPSFFFTIHKHELVNGICLIGIIAILLGMVL